MSSLLLIALVLLQVSMTAQEPSAENFRRFREHAIDRLKGFEGRPLNSNLYAVFHIAEDIRIVTDAEMVLPGHRLSLTFATNSPDIFLTDSHKMATGTHVTVFHTDMTLALRAAAAGESVSTLQRIISDENVSSHFRDVVLKWNRELPQMLARQQRK
jgi:hypothetical protein